MFCQLNHMFDIVNDRAPGYMKNHIDMVYNHHSYNTRASVMSCKIPRVNSTARRTFFHTGICLWNSLPLEIKQRKSQIALKSRQRFSFGQGCPSKRNQSTAPCAPYFWSGVFIWRIGMMCNYFQVISSVSTLYIFLYMSATQNKINSIQV